MVRQADDRARRARRPDRRDRRDSAVRAHRLRVHDRRLDSGRRRAPSSRPMLQARSSATRSSSPSSRSTRRTSRTRRSLCRTPGGPQPFEELMGVMGKPQYGTYDPTWMLAIFYPLFFGMIVGDIGYGAGHAGHGHLAADEVQGQQRGTARHRRFSARRPRASSSSASSTASSSATCSGRSSPTSSSRSGAQRAVGVRVSGAGAVPHGPAVRAHAARDAHHVPHHRDRHRARSRCCSAGARRLQRHQDEALVARV